MSKTVLDGWVNGKFGDLARVQNGYAFKSSDFSERGHAAAIRMSNLKKGRIDLSEAKYVPECIVEGLDQFRLSEGDFLFGMSGSLDNYAWVTRDTGVCYLNQRVGCLRAKPKSDSLYTAYCYLSETVKREIVGLAAGAAQLNISGNQLESIPVPIPPLPEQKKIAAILSSVDNVIETTRAQIDKLKDLKTGMMQELLTKGVGSGGLPHKEFKDSPVGRIPVFWDFTKLGDVTQKFQNGYAFSASGYVDEGIPIISMASIGLDGNFNTRYTKTKYWDASERSSLKRYVVKDGDLLIAMTDVTPTMALIGRCCVARINRDHLLNQRVGLIKLDFSRVDKQFFAYYSNHDIWRDYARGMSGLGAQANLGTTQIANGIIPLPPLEEQKRIASILQSVDDLIEDKGENLHKNQSVKKALMQDLLTGKVRVNVEQKESAAA